MALSPSKSAIVPEKQRKDFEERQENLARKETAAEGMRLLLERRQAEFEQNSQHIRAEIQTQREHLAAEVARQTEIAVAEQLADRIQIEKKTIAEAEERRARVRFADEIAERKRDLQEQADRIKQLTVKLASSQNAEAEFKRREREFQDRERELTLKVEQEVSAQLDQARAAAAGEATERLRLQLSDRERQIRELTTKVEEASRTAHQGSQQAQGETLELTLEEQLRRHFPFDELHPVPKGQCGGDTLHVVRDASGRECGRILWEFKRTNKWQSAWVTKLKSDQRAARADIAVIVSQAMPPEVQHFNQVDGVWVSSLSCTLPVATALRATLLQLATQLRSTEGQQTKSQLVYAYLTGSRFRARIEAITERWSEMQKDLAEEKKTTMKRWAKRDQQLHTLLESTSGIYGDLQGIVGCDLAEIEALGETLLLTS
jgi:hypothetical protein